jgi:hypothetical protein
VDSWRRSFGAGLVAVVAALAAVCVMVPAAQAVTIAFQSNTGGLWTTPPIQGAGQDKRAGMMAGTSPSINNWGIIAFQANNGNLDVTGRGDLGLGMMPGTSPSIDDDGQVVFQTNTGSLWAAGGDSCNCSWNLGVMPGTSPSIAAENVKGGENFTIAFQADTGKLWDLQLNPAATAAGIAPDTSPSTNDADQVAYQGDNGSLWIYELGVALRISAPGWRRVPARA